MVSLVILIVKMDLGRASYMRILLGLVNQVVALLGRLVSVARLMLGYHVVRVVRLLLMFLLGRLLHGDG